jgi:RecA/RadA recombinase
MPQDVGPAEGAHAPAESESLGRLFTRRITILAGHFGSGKTEITLNGALELAALGETVTLVDLDVVKPYFRSRSAREFLRQGGVDLVAPQGEFFSSDLPIILPQIRSAVMDPSRKVLLDAGGDDTGARVIGSLADVIREGEETDFLLVLNFRRPFTPDVASAAAMIREIEATARLKVTGLVSNTHLLHLTTALIAVEGYELAAETARRVGARLAAVTVEEPLAAQVRARIPGCPVVPLRRIVRPPFEGPRQQRTVGPLFVVG